ncbi:MAG TPA: 5-formyltetrahydrofolate cyclo-ligase [Noviherbaspirillum sp.]
MKHERRVDTMPENTVQKSTLRRELLANRQGIDAEVRRASDGIISTRVVAWCRTHRPSVLGVYVAIRGEPDLMEAYKEIEALGTRLALPVVSVPDAPLTFMEWSPGDPLAKDAFGVPIPVTGENLKPDALLIPCVGFDERGFRLGYGGGFYDRTLASTPRPVAIGIAYACMQTTFDLSPYDVPMDLVITDAPV